MIKECCSFPLALIIALSLTVAARGRQAQTSEELKIKQYREEIGRLLKVSPPPEARDGHLKALISLRGKLRDLLVEKRGALKKDIRDLQSENASAEYREYVKQLESVLRDVEGEVQSLDSALAQVSNVPNTAPVVSNLEPDAAGDRPSSPGAGSMGERDADAQSDAEANNAVKSVETPDAAATRAAREEAKAKFEREVASASAKLAESAAPPDVAESEVADPGCTQAGRPATTIFSKYDESICRLASDLLKRREKRISLRTDKGALFPILVAKLLKMKGEESYVALVTEAQETRTDQQVGAGPEATGTTSLVVKGGIPYALGFAVENGAAIETRSGTTVTFRLNPVGTLNMLAGKGFITGFQQSANDSALNLLRKASVGFTFDTSRGDQPGIFTGDRQQLSSVSARYEFINDRDPRLKRYEREWELLVSGEGLKLAETVWEATLAIQSDFETRTSPPPFKDPALQAWLEQTNGRLAVAGLSDINAVAKLLREQASLLPVNLVSSETADAVTGFARQFESYSRAKERLLDMIASGRVLTFEYTNQRGMNAPDTSNFRFIASTGTLGRIDLTANGSLTIFNKKPLVTSLVEPRPGRVRDFQFAGQLDVPFNLGEVGQFVLWFSGRYERLMEDAATRAGTIVPNTKGDIAIGQFGLKVPIQKLGMHLPISFTIANRTELVKEREVRGNFGFTFNIDSILARLNPFGSP